MIVKVRNPGLPIKNEEKANLIVVCFRIKCAKIQ